MIKVKTSELTGAALDWAVAKCEGLETINSSYTKGRGFCIRGGMVYAPSADWTQGGPIIEREKLDLWWCEGNGFYTASRSGGKEVEDGPTPLIAAMRCYVASKLGDIVEIPKELMPC
jgi:hypothetical protein